MLESGADWETITRLTGLGPEDLQDSTPAPAETGKPQEGRQATPASGRSRAARATVQA